MMQSSQLCLLEIVEGIGLCETDVVQRQSSILFRPLCCCFARSEQSVGLVRHCTVLKSLPSMNTRVTVPGIICDGYDSSTWYCTFYYDMGYEAKVKR